MSAFNENNILMYFHCKECFNDRPEDQSPQEWSKLSAGFTKFGLQVWCDRCEANVIHIDFQGVKHPADMTRVGDSG